MLKESPIQRFVFRGVDFWLKRDDLLHSDLDGNKARKFYTLYNKNLDSIDTLVSFGGIQSNAMYSLSALAKIKNKIFIYYSKKLPKVAQNCDGNLKYALQNGMILKEIDNDKYEFMAQGRYVAKDNELFVPQGGAFEQSREGVEMLASELNLFCTKTGMKNPKAVVSSGTGTTALFLTQKFCGDVYTVPCVGDKSYLVYQMERLQKTQNIPTILETKDKYIFAKPYSKLLDIYNELLSCGVEFDMIYDSKAWLAIAENIELFTSDTIFIHSGGVRGNESQLKRYAYKGFV